MDPTLVCTVRGCGAPLSREGASYVCAAKHSFNVAKSGYVNLIQPQHRRSLNAGDSKEAVAARRRVLDAGHGRALLEGLVEIVGAIAPAKGASALDVGCGEGTFLSAIATRFELDGTGVDISLPAIEAAAKRHTAQRWIVANADLGLPFEDRSFRLVLSIAGRRNAPELRRVIHPEGRFV